MINKFALHLVSFLVVGASGVYYVRSKTPPSPLAANVPRSDQMIVASSEPQVTLQPGLTPKASATSLGLPTVSSLNQNRAAIALASRSTKLPAGRQSQTDSVSNSIESRPWDLGTSKLKMADLAPWLSATNQPAAISYWEGDQYHYIENPNGQGIGANKNKVLNFSDEDAAKKVAEERTAETAQNDQFNHSFGQDVGDKNADKAGDRLETFAYRVVGFFPGLTDNGADHVPPPNNMSASLRGPDFSFTWVDESDTDGLSKLRQRLVTFGHGGSMVFEVGQNGWVQDEEGTDFVIFENPFRWGRGKIYQEFARVGVAEKNEPQAYKWFACEPQRGVIIGCAGVVPTSEGGDRFDLGSVGLKRIRFIKIQDTGGNANYGKDTEGFDLDSLHLLNAFGPLN